MEGVRGSFGGVPGPSALRGSMRSVSYVQRVALEFSGSLFPHAVCLGDVDNDAVSACALQGTLAACVRGAGLGRKPTREPAARSMRAGASMAPCPGALC